MTLLGKRIPRSAGLTHAALVLALLSLVAAPCPRALAYEIGHASLSYSDPARGGRMVPTEAYYPADSAGEDVPIAVPPSGGFPVVSFGHGFLIPWSDYDFVWEGVVPEGFIVLLPDTESGFLPDHLDLGQDLAFVLRELRSDAGDAGSLFYGAVSQSGAVCGHSMGGGASFLGAASDPSVAAIANLAAAETSPSAISASSSIAVPALVFSGSNDCVTPPATNQTPMYDALSSECKAHVTLAGGSHCQFAEYNFTCSLGEGGCPSPTITRVEQHDLTISLLLPWLRHVLMDDPAAWVEFEDLLATLPGVASDTECVPASVSSEEDDLLGETGMGIALAPTTPNPFSNGTTIRVFTAERMQAEVSIYSLSGRLVRRIHDGPLPAGDHAFNWDGCGRDGCPAASGVYRCRLATASGSTDRAVVLVR